MDDQSIQNALNNRSQDVEVTSSLQYKTMYYVQEKSRQDRLRKERLVYKIGGPFTCAITFCAVMLLCKPSDELSQTPIQMQQESPQVANRISETSDSSTHAFSNFIGSLVANDVDYKIHGVGGDDFMQVYEINIDEVCSYFIILSSTTEQSEALSNQYLELLDSETDYYSKVAIDDRNYILYDQSNQDILTYYELYKQHIKKLPN